MAEIRPIDRFIAYLEYKKTIPSAAEKLLGLANAYIQNSKNRKGEIGSAILNRIAKEYLDLNLIWLITGEGNMLLPQSERVTEITYTPTVNKDITVVSEPKQATNAPPTLRKTAPPTAPPTHNLGLPKVVTITENNAEVISLVNVKAAAGYLNGYADPEYVGKLPTLSIPGLKGGTHRAFELRGHSMSPTMHNGSIGIGKWVESFDDIRDRYCYFVITKSEGIVLKRVLNRINDTGKLILISDNHNKRDYPNILLDPEEVLELWKLRGGFIFEFPEPDGLYNRFNDLEAKVTIMAAKMQNMLK